MHFVRRKEIIDRGYLAVNGQDIPTFRKEETAVDEEYRDKLFL